METQSSAVCPSCVADLSGRWLLAWKLGWMVACPVHRCYLVTTCRCGRRLHSVDRGTFSRQRCVGPGPRGGHGPCRQSVCDLPATEVHDHQIFRDQLHIAQLLVPILDRSNWQAEYYRRAELWSEILWMIRLTVTHGTVELLSGLDIDVMVFDAFARFCQLRDDARPYCGVIPESVTVPESDERLVMAAFLRVALRVILADDAREAIAWFCERSQWKVHIQDLLYPDDVLSDRLPGAVRGFLQVPEYW